MITSQTLNCQKRDIKNKGYLHQMKRKDFVPGIVYGKGQAGSPIFMSGGELSRVFSKHGLHGLFSLQMEGEAKPDMVLIKEIQKHPVSGKVNHVDFMTVNMNETIHSTVAVYIHGEDEVIKNGGVLQAGAKEIEVSCLPENLPEHLMVDVSQLSIGHKITVGDLQVPAGVEVITDPDAIVATILSPNRASLETQEMSEGQAEEAEEKTE